MKKLYALALGLVVIFAVSYIAPSNSNFLSENIDEDSLSAASVRGFYRSSGTYVPSHVRSNPNALKYDNRSYNGGNMYNKSYSSPTKNYSSSWYQPKYSY